MTQPTGRNLVLLLAVSSFVYQLTHSVSIYFVSEGPLLQLPQLQCTVHDVATLLCTGLFLSVTDMVMVTVSYSLGSHWLRVETGIVTYQGTVVVNGLMVSMFILLILSHAGCGR